MRTRWELSRLSARTSCGLGDRAAIYLFWPVAVWLFSEKALLLITSLIVLIGSGVDGGLLPQGGVKIVHASTLGSMQYLGWACWSHSEGGVSGACWGRGVCSSPGAHAIRHAGLEFRWIWYGLTFTLALLVYQTIHAKPLLQSRYLAFTGSAVMGSIDRFFRVRVGIYRHWAGRLDGRHCLFHPVFFPRCHLIQRFRTADPELARAFS